jgi:hypothetical protein
MILGQLLAQKGNFEITRNLLSVDVPPDKIASVTELTLAEIEKLRDAD